MNHSASGGGHRRNQVKNCYRRNLMTNLILCVGKKIALPTCPENRIKRYCLRNKADGLSHRIHSLFLSATYRRKIEGYYRWVNFRCRLGLKVGHFCTSFCIPTYAFLILSTRNTPRRFKSCFPGRKFAHILPLQPLIQS